MIDSSLFVTISSGVGSCISWFWTDDAYPIDQRFRILHVWSGSRDNVMHHDKISLS